MASTPSEPTRYLDWSALIKLVVDEPETPALRESLGESPGILTSELVLVEVPRAMQRLTTGLNKEPRQALFAAAESLLHGIALVPLTRELLLAAGRLKEAWLRSLDAIHLAAAISVAEDLDQFITYDQRQAAVGAKAGLSVISPGADPGV